MRALARGGGLALLWRAGLTVALVGAIGLLPWLTRTDPALTVLRARSSERDPEPGTLRAVRGELGLDEGPLELLARWLGGLLHGDAGTSWVSGTEVLPAVGQALGISLTLMAGALAVAVTTAAAVCARTLRLGSGRGLGGRDPNDAGSAMPNVLPAFPLRTRRGRTTTRTPRPSPTPQHKPGGRSPNDPGSAMPNGLPKLQLRTPRGPSTTRAPRPSPRRKPIDRDPTTATTPALLAALPEFLLASLLASVLGVQLGWLPALGWYGPQWMVLPSLALGLPAGAVLGRMLDGMLPGAFAEPWATAAAARGLPPRAVARQALRRCVPGLLPSVGLFVVGLTGGAVAVEQVFDIPGLGRLTLRAALAQDLPVLQTGTLALVLLAATVGALARGAARRLIGPALRDGALHSPHRPGPPAPRTPPLVYGALLVAVTGCGLLRDPLAVDPLARLQPPSWAHPFGTDALGRDVLARTAHGALATLGTGLAVSAAALVAGVLLGLVPRLSGPLADTVNALPPVLAGLLVTGVAGAGAWTPALAVAFVAWSPLATHTSALLRQERATAHLAATRALGAGRRYLLRHELLPAVLPPVTRLALLRLPGVALSLAALGFLGLGSQPPAPEWGLLLAENQPYVERAPWAVLFPAAVLALLGALAVTAGDGVRLPRRRRLRPERRASAPDPLPSPNSPSPAPTSSVSTSPSEAL